MTDSFTLKNLVRNLKNADVEPLRALIDEYLLKRDRSPNRYDGHDISMVPRPRPPGRISPSSVYSCSRAAAMRFAGVRGTRRLDPDQELLFEDGNWRHHKWQYLFYDMELVLGRDRFRVISIEDFVVMPELYVAGSLDVEIAIKMPSGKWRRYVIDIKGINDRGWTWVNKENAPKDDNVRQILLYCKARGIKRGILLYDNKNNNRPKTFVVDFTSELWAETVEWIEKLVADLKRKHLPSRHPGCRAGTMLFEGCPYKGPCWKTDSEDLSKIVFANWRGIDDAWERGMNA